MARSCIVTPLGSTVVVHHVDMAFDLQPGLLEDQGGRQHGILILIVEAAPLFEDTRNEPFRNLEVGEDRIDPPYRGQKGGLPGAPTRLPRST